MAKIKKVTKIRKKDAKLVANASGAKPTGNIKKKGRIYVVTVKTD